MTTDDDLLRVAGDSGAWVNAQNPQTLAQARALTAVLILCAMQRGMPLEDAIDHVCGPGAWVALCERRATS